MKFLGSKDADLSEVAFVAACASCQQPVEVSVFCVEITESANRICRERGWFEIGRDEMALCAPCYAKHRAKLARDFELEYVHEAECWKVFRQRWGRGNEREDADLERRFLLSFPYLRSWVKGWVELQQAKGGGRRRRTKADAGSGFGASEVDE